MMMNIVIIMIYFIMTLSILQTTVTTWYNFSVEMNLFPPYGQTRISISRIKMILIIHFFHKLEKREVKQNVHRNQSMSLLFEVV